MVFNLISGKLFAKLTVLKHRSQGGINVKLNFCLLSSNMLLAAAETFGAKYRRIGASHNRNEQAGKGQLVLPGQ